MKTDITPNLLRSVCNQNLERMYKSVSKLHGRSADNTTDDLGVHQANEPLTSSRLGCLRIEDYGF